MHIYIYICENSLKLVAPFSLKLNMRERETGGTPLGLSCPSLSLSLVVGPFPKNRFLVLSIENISRVYLVDMSARLPPAREERFESHAGGRGAPPGCGSAAVQAAATATASGACGRAWRCMAASRCQTLSPDECRAPGGVQIFGFQLEIPIHRLSWTSTRRPRVGSANPHV